jgi:predicted Fe-Mo cluster-binding NifX family protein
MKAVSFEMRFFSKGDYTMKIAVTSTGLTLEDNIPTEFRDSEYLLIVDFDTLKYEAIVGPVGMDNSSAAGNLLAQQLGQAGVNKILTSHIDLNVLKSFLIFLQGRGIQVVDGMSGSVRSAIQQFKEICMAETVILPCKNILGRQSPVQEG